MKRWKGGRGSHVNGARHEAPAGARKENEEKEVADNLSKRFGNYSKTTNKIKIYKTWIMDFKYIYIYIS